MVTSTSDGGGGASTSTSALRSEPSLKIYKTACANDLTLLELQMLFGFKKVGQLLDVPEIDQLAKKYSREEDGLVDGLRQTVGGATNWHESKKTITLISEIISRSIKGSQFRYIESVVRPARLSHADTEKLFQDAFSPRSDIRGSSISWQPLFLQQQSQHQTHYSRTRPQNVVPDDKNNIEMIRLPLFHGFRRGDRNVPADIGIGIFRQSYYDVLEVLDKREENSYYLTGTGRAGFQWALLNLFVWARLLGVKSNERIRIVDANEAREKAQSFPPYLISDDKNGCIPQVPLSLRLPQFLMFQCGVKREQYVIVGTTADFNQCRVANQGSSFPDNDKLELTATTILVRRVHLSDISEGEEATVIISPQESEHDGRSVSWTIDAHELWIINQSCPSPSQNDRDDGALSRCTHVSTLNLEHNDKSAMALLFYMPSYSPGEFIQLLRFSDIKGLPAELPPRDIKDKMRSFLYVCGSKVSLLSRFSIIDAKKFIARNVRKFLNGDFMQYDRFSCFCHEQLVPIWMQTGTAADSSPLMDDLRITTTDKLKLVSQFACDEVERQVEKITRQQKEALELWMRTYWVLSVRNYVYRSLARLFIPAIEWFTIKQYSRRASILSAEHNNTTANQEYTIRAGLNVPHKSIKNEASFHDKGFFNSSKKLWILLDYDTPGDFLLVDNENARMFIFQVASEESVSPQKTILMDQALLKISHSFSRVYYVFVHLTLPPTLLGDDYGHMIPCFLRWSPLETSAISTSS